MSKILDSELVRRKPVEGSHGKVIGTTIVDSKLVCEIIQRIESMAGIEAFLVFTVTALDLAVVTRGIRANEFVAHSQLGSCIFKQRR